MQAKAYRRRSPSRSPARRSPPPVCIPVTTANRTRPTAVGIFAQRFPVLSETFVVNEVRALQRIGHDVSVEAWRRPEDFGAGADGQIGAHYAGEETRRQRAQALAWLAARHPLRTTADAVARLRRPEKDRGRPTRRLAVRARRLAALAPVHIHTHFASGIADDAYRIARLLGASSSVTAHAWDIYVSPRKLSERLVRSDFVTSGCDYTVAELKRVVGPEHEGRVFRQVMGVDHEAFRRRGPLPGTRHVVAVGRLVEKKGFVHLVRAAQALDDVRISIAGEGPERETLEAEIERLDVQDRVSLLGAASPGEVRKLLETADLLCMPCVVAADGDRDSMPVVVKEAMAMELLIVASDEVGLPEIVRPPWGELVPPGDDAALAKAIRRALELEPSARAQAGAAGRSFVAAHANVYDETSKLSGLIEACRVQQSS
jgi:colanic acid/amylovoran biosynthesis glycosyltransferase